MKNKDTYSDTKVIIFLADGMADEPLQELGGKTPLEAVETPYMDSIAKMGQSGTFLSLPDGFPTSSDVANMSVIGYDLPSCYPGRGPLEAVSQNIELKPADIAYRCNLINAENGILEDYSAGHIDNKISSEIMRDLQSEFGNEKLTFHAGVSYRNLLVLHGDEFSDKVLYQKPDSSQGMNIEELKLRAFYPGDKKGEYTAEFLLDLQERTASFLAEHPLNKGLKNPPNMIWPWSPGHKPDLVPFSEKYNGKTGAVITAVDVIAGIAKCAEMDVIPVEGATGFIDTNYEGKAQAAIDGIKKYDFIYLHVEAIDECSHMGDLNLKMRAIKDFEKKLSLP
jgi:2,3-bisphosphoglycerate-independent phosphoglycerate mutase